MTRFRTMAMLVCIGVVVAMTPAVAQETTVDRELLLDFIESWHSGDGESSFNSDYDVLQNGYIDADDLLLIIRQYPTKALPTARPYPTDTPTGQTEPTTTPTPTDTATAAVTDTMTPTPTATATGTTGDGVLVQTTLISGDPFVENATLTIGLEVTGYTGDDAIGTYAYQFNFDSSVISYVTGSAADGGDGLNAEPSVSVLGDGRLGISAFNATSTLNNGTLCTLEFVTSTGLPTSYAVVLQAFGSNPLVTTSFAEIDHTLSSDNTIFVQSGPTPVATVAAAVGSGDPCTDSQFTVHVTIANNSVGPVGSYAFSLLYDPAQLTFGSVADLAFGSAPMAATTVTTMATLAVSGANQASDLQNGGLFSVVFDVNSPGSLDEMTLQLIDKGDTPLTTPVQQSPPYNPLDIPHVFDNSAVNLLCTSR